MNNIFKYLFLLYIPISVYCQQQCGSFNPIYTICKFICDVCSDEDNTRNCLAVKGICTNFYKCTCDI